MQGETTIVARGTVSNTLRHDATNKTGCAASGGKNARSALRLHGVNFSAHFCLGWTGRCFCSANTTSSEYGRSAISAYRRGDVRIRNLHARFLRRVWLYLRRYFLPYLYLYCPFAWGLRV